MKEKELKRLSRTELLELLLVQTKETERLQKKLEKADQKLSERYLKVQQAGTLAQAVVDINGVMEAAQAAAQQYLDNIERMEQETKARCDKMLEDAKSKAEMILQKAQAVDPENTLIEEIYELLEETNE